MTASALQANATLRPNVEPDWTTVEDPATRSWERGTHVISRDRLLDYCRAKLNRLAALAPRWDGDRALPPTPTALYVINGILGQLVTDDGPTPQISPIPTGGLQVEWLVGGTSVIVGVSDVGQVEVLAEGPNGETYLDGEFPYWNVDVFVLDQARIILEKLSHDVVVRAVHHA